MVKLVVKDNKKLVLNQVVCKKLQNIKLENFDYEIEKFYQHLCLLNAKVYGPLIVKSCGTNIGDDGCITTDFDIYIQAHDAYKYSNVYEFFEFLSVPSCLYVHFEDSSEYLQYAYAKLELHIYENDVQTDGTIYTVYVNNCSEKMIVDIFRPVINL
ncbi:AraC family transcriptional regulator [Enterococcus cecorum]|uniref:AraC family transcriptional regulator n=1 Tax=Enterococcus cecorum TaxID=44008 RepID=UPI003F1EE15C